MVALLCASLFGWIAAESRGVLTNLLVAVVVATLAIRYGKEKETRSSYRTYALWAVVISIPMVGLAFLAGLLAECLVPVDLVSLGLRSRHDRDRAWLRPAGVLRIPFGTTSRMTVLRHTSLIVGLLALAFGAPADAQPGDPAAKELQRAASQVQGLHHVDHADRQGRHAAPVRVQLRSEARNLRAQLQSAVAAKAMTPSCQDLISTRPASKYDYRRSECS